METFGGHLEMHILNTIEIPTATTKHNMTNRLNFCLHIFTNIFVKYFVEIFEKLN